MLKAKLFMKVINVPFQYENCKDKLVVYVDMDKIKLSKDEKRKIIKLDGIIGNLNETEMSIYEKLNLPFNIEYRISGNIDYPVMINSKGKADIYIEKATLSNELIINGSQRIHFENNEYLYPDMCCGFLSRQLININTKGTVVFQKEMIRGNLNFELNAMNVCFYDSKIRVPHKNILINSDNTSIIDSEINCRKLDLKCESRLRLHGSDLIYKDISINKNEEEIEKVKVLAFRGKNG